MSTWGQGAVNNTNGFGQAPKNDKNKGNFGKVCFTSYGHPETNLTGEVAEFTNTKSFNNETFGTIIGATANSGDMSYLNNQGRISASVWFKVDSQVTQSFQFLTMVADRNPYFRFQLSYDVSGAFPNTVANLTITGSQTLGGTYGTLTNGWHHFLVVYDALGTQMFYIDGNAMTINVAGNQSFTSTTLKPTFFEGTGTLTEYNATQLAVWNRVLTSQEINDVYNNGCPGNLTTLSPNTWLKMDDAFDNGLGTTLPDSGSDNATVQSLNVFSQGIVTDSPCP